MKLTRETSNQQNETQVGEYTTMKPVQKTSKLDRVWKILSSQTVKTSTEKINFQK